MLRIYQEENEPGYENMSIQKFGTKADAQAWAELYRQTAAEMGHDPNGKYDAATRMEINMMMCRKWFEAQV